MRQSIPPTDARRLLGGGPVTLVTTSWRSNTNVMPAAFVTPLSFEPPLIGVAVHPSRHTHDMIKYSEEFALNIPSRELLHHCQYLGSLTGRDSNKLELTKLPTFRARHVDAPLLEGCVGYIECGVEDALHHRRPHALRGQGRRGAGREGSVRGHMAARRSGPEAACTTSA